MTPAELQALDCIKLPRFKEQQAKAIVDMVRSRGMLNSEPPAFEGRGIVIAGGGKYLDWSWALCMRLRAMGTQLPVQVWHLGPREMPEWANPMFQKLNVETVDAHQVMMKHPVREMGGWHLKTYAVRHCPWERVLFIDADCFPALLPEELFNDVDVVRHGSLFFHDVGKHNRSWGYVDFGLLPPEKEWETGQFLWNKTSGWLALRWAMWCHEHTDAFWAHLYGDKGTIECCFRSTQCPHMMGERSEWEGYGIGHYFKGRLAFTHRMADKRGEFPRPDWLTDLFAEWQSLAMGRK